MVDTPATVDSTLKTIGDSRSQNTSNASSRKYLKKDGTNKLVHDDGDDDIASHQKSVFLFQSYIGQEEGRTTMVAAPALKHIGDSRSQITYDKSSRK